MIRHSDPNTGPGPVIYLRRTPEADMRLGSNAANFARANTARQDDDSAVRAALWLIFGSAAIIAMLAILGAWTVAGWIFG